MRLARGFLLAAAGTFVSGVLLSCGENDDSASGDAAPLSAPSSVSATDGAFPDKVVVTWDAVQGASSYRIYMAIGAAQAAYQCIAKGVTGTTFEDAAATAGRIYYYKVQSLAGVAEGTMSASDMGFAGETKPKPPLAPTNLTASDARDAVLLSWTASDGAQSYKIFRSPTLNGEYKETASGLTATTYKDTDVAAGAQYCYKAKAVNAAGESGFSNYDCGALLPPPPAKPSGVKASDGTFGNKVLVTWQPVAGAVSYAVQREVAGGTSEIIVKELKATEFSDYSVVVGTHYLYQVRGSNTGGDGEFSAQDEGWAAEGAALAPATPTNLKASDDQNRQITVTWDAAANAKSYKVYRADSASDSFDETRVVAPNVSQVSWVDTAVTPGRTYFYSVRAVNDKGQSNLSEADSGTTPGEAPDAPLNVQASDGADCKIAVTWNSVAGADSYRVYRSEKSDSGFSEVARDITANSWDDSKISFKVKFYYSVTAVNSSGESARSAPNSGDAKLPGAKVSAKDGGDYASDLSWSVVACADSYVIRRSKATLFSWEDVTTVDRSITTYHDANLDQGPWGSGVLYYYRIRSKLGDQISDEGLLDWVSESSDKGP